MAVVEEEQEVVEGVVLYPVRCSHCGRRCAWTRMPGEVVRTKIFCTDWCFREGPVTPQSRRNAILSFMVSRGRTTTEVAEATGLNRVTVFRALRRKKRQED